MSQMRLERSTTNRVVGGVCGGIAEYLAVDPTLVRVTFVIVTIITAGLGILGYILLLVLMPLPGQPAPFVSSPSPGESALRPTSSQGENSLPSSEAHAADTERRRMAIGYLLIALGVVFFAGQLGIFRPVRFELVWPLVLVALGALLIVQRVRS